MSYRPGHRLRFVGERYPEPCSYCQTPASRLRGGVRVCEAHYRVRAGSDLAVLALAVAGVGVCLSWFAIAALHRDGGQALAAAGVGLACAWLAATAWKESR